MKIAAIIQARMASTRLPGKVLKVISGKPMLWHMIDRLRESFWIDEIILAIPDSKQNDELEAFAKAFNLHQFRGREEDVLSRYYGAATEFGADVIVRLTSDCPLIDPVVVDEVVLKHLLFQADYTANTLKRTFPRGMDTEVFSFEALERACKEASEDYERENVTPYIYYHPSLFQLKSIEATRWLRRPDLRLTVDTEEDLKLMREVFKRLYRVGQIFYLGEVIDFLDKNPELVAINAHIRQKELGEC